MFYIFFAAQVVPGELIRPLKSLLENRGLKVWLDEEHLTVGTSIREAIDSGIRSSRYAVLVLTRSFLEKNWPVKELNAFLMRETKVSQSLLPVWHKVSPESRA